MYGREWTEYQESKSKTVSIEQIVKEIDHMYTIIGDIAASEVSTTYCDGYMAALRYVKNFIKNNGTELHTP